MQKVYSEEWCRDAAALLKQLQGVYSVRIIPAQDGSRIEAVDVLADAARGPKQVVRDIQSSLSAAYSIDVDYKLISIAQLPFSPFGDQQHEAADSHRVEFVGLCYREMSGQCSVQVTLSDKGMMYEGEAGGKASHRSVDKLAARATLNAIHSLIGDEDVYTLVGIQRLQMPPFELCVSLIQNEESSLVLSGTAALEAGSLHGVVRSVLDALNRNLSLRLSKGR